MSSDGGLRLFDYLDKNAYVISTSVFCVVATISNLFFMITILASQTLRSSSKHILIFTLCLTDFYMGVFEFPLFAQFYSLERWIHDPKLLEALDFAEYFIMLSFRVNLVVAIVVSSILRALTNNKSFLMMTSVSMIITALGYSLILVLPVFKDHGMSNPDPLDSCFWSVNSARQEFMSIAAFFPQALIMVVFVVDLVIMSCCFSRSFPQASDGEPRRFPLDVVLACVMMLVYVAPFRIVHGYFSSCSGEESCRIMYTVRGVIGRWEAVRPCVMPFVWLLCRETRMGIKQVCCCGRNQPVNRPVYLPTAQEMPNANQPHMTKL